MKFAPSDSTSTQTFSLLYNTCAFIEKGALSIMKDVLMYDLLRDSSEENTRRYYNSGPQDLPISHSQNASSFSFLLAGKYRHAPRLYVLTKYCVNHDGFFCELIHALFQIALTPLLHEYSDKTKYRKTLLKFRKTPVFEACVLNVVASLFHT